MQFGRGLSAAALGILLVLEHAHAQPAVTPPGFEPIENALLAFMQSHNLPGASIAIARNGRLEFARGYGYSDQEHGELVEPTSVFRFGSIGKTVTAIAVMKLVEAGKLSLDTRAFDVL